ncbi:MAG TPA: hypothetical protein VH916_13640, partial [Dehalococcoidia bacterium]
RDEAVIAAYLGADDGGAGVEQTAPDVRQTIESLESAAGLLGGAPAPEEQPVQPGAETEARW